MYTRQGLSGGLQPGDGVSKLGMIMIVLALPFTTNIFEQNALTYLAQAGSVEILLATVHDTCLLIPTFERNTVC